MTKKELVTMVANKLQITYDSAENAVVTTLGAITLGLKESGTVIIAGFGTFSVQERKAHMSRNPRTGEKFMAGPRKKVTFKAGKSVRDTVCLPNDDSL